MPDYVSAVLWGSVAALCSTLTIVIGALRTELRDTIKSYGRLARARFDRERAELSTWASDQAVAATEEAAKRDSTLKGTQKAERARQTAEQLLGQSGVPSSVPPAVIEASVQRMRASAATPGLSLSPGSALSIPVVVTSSSAPPEDGEALGAERPIPRAPPLPTGYRVELQPGKKR